MKSKFVVVWRKGRPIFYKVPEDDGKRLLGTLDLIAMERERLKEKGRARRHKRVSRTMIKWLKAHIEDYGIQMDPFKNAVLQHWNIANGREKEEENE